MRGRLVGLTLGICCTIVLCAALLPLRSTVTLATVTLVFIIPPVVGVVVGGLIAGLVAIVISALALDFFFLPPYQTLTIGTDQNWVALGVYFFIVLLLARVVESLKIARLQVHRSSDAMGRLFELSELLVQDQSVDDLLTTIVQAVQRFFNIEDVSLLVLEEGRLVVAASGGHQLSSQELARLDPRAGLPVSISTALGSSGDLRTVALAASGRPVGLLVLRTSTVSDADKSVLITFANDAALAIERARLHEQVLRTKFLEEVDRLRHALMGAVSHDLRTPLATIKVASSTLVNRARALSSEDAHELHQLIEIESDRLTRLVTNLLDMTRIEAGVFTVKRAPTPVGELVSEALDTMGPSLKEGQVKVVVPACLPDVDVDRLLFVQVLVNLLDNAQRHSPEEGVITITGEQRNDRVVLMVADQGPGVAPGDREAVFNRFIRFNTGGRAGLGLTIAKTFVEAHHERIWCEDAPQGGAEFAFSMPLAAATGEGSA